MTDFTGHTTNILHVTECVPGNLESISEFEAPASPESSYGRVLPVDDDFAKEPPALPPQLPLIVPLSSRNLEDVDCMPLNPVENIPESLRRPNHVSNNFCSGFSDLRLDEQKEFKTKDSMTFDSTESLEATDGASHVTSYSYPMNTLMNQTNGETLDAIVQAKAAVNEVTVVAQQAMYGQPFTLAQIQVREDYTPLILAPRLKSWPTFLMTFSITGRAPVLVGVSIDEVDASQPGENDTGVHLRPAQNVKEEPPDDTGDQSLGPAQLKAHEGALLQEAGPICSRRTAGSGFQPPAPPLSSF